MTESATISMAPLSPVAGLADLVALDVPPTLLLPVAGFVSLGVLSAFFSHSAVNPRIMSSTSYQAAPPRNMWNSVFAFQCCDVGYEQALSMAVSKGISANA